MTSTLLLLLLLLIESPMVAAFWPFDGDATTTPPPSIFGGTDWILRMTHRDQCLGWDAVRGLISQSLCEPDSAQLWRFNRTIQSFAGHHMCLGMDRQSFVGDNCSYWNGSAMDPAMRVAFMDCDDTDANQLFFMDAARNLIVSEKCKTLCLTYRNIVGRFSLHPCSDTYVSQNLTLTNVSASWAKRIAKAHPEIPADSIISAVSTDYISRTLFSESHSERTLARLGIIAFIAVAGVMLSTFVNIRTLGQSIVHRHDDRGSWMLIPTEDLVCELPAVA